MKKIYFFLVCSVLFAFLLSTCAQPGYDAQSRQGSTAEDGAEELEFYETNTDEVLYNPENQLSRSLLSCHRFYFRLLSKTSAQALTAADVTDSTDKTIIQFPWTANDSQVWLLEYYRGGYFKIVSKSTGSVLTVKEHSAKNSPSVSAQSWKKLNSQLWMISYAGEGYIKIRSKQGLLVLSVQDGSPLIGAPVVVSSWLPFRTQNNQKWKIEEAPLLPTNWEDMEIESKWTTDRENYQKIVDAFPDKGTKYGYRLNVRWKGIPKKFVDTYYDNAALHVGSQNHAFRSRICYESKPKAPNAELETLENAVWERDWQKVQYKGTATIIDAIWFRIEKGDAELTEAQAMAVISGNDLTHEAAQLALGYKGDFDFSTMQPIMLVTDYRYRVEFQDENKNPVFELSLDRATLEKLQEGTTSLLTEAELEIVKDNYTRQDLEKLFEISYQIQKEFNLNPSTSSKGEL